MTRRVHVPGITHTVARDRWEVVVVCLLACALVVGVALRTVPTLASWTDAEWTHGTVGTAQLRCGTDATFQSHAQAKALGGALLSNDLDALASVRGMDLLRTPTAPAVPTPSTATDLGPDDGDPTLDTYANPLAVSAVTGIAGLSVSGFGVGLPVGSAGALNQYTQVTTTGRAVAASGLVSNTGGVLVGRGTPSNQLPQPAVVDVSSVFPGITNISGARLQVGAVASSAALDYCPALSDRIWGPGTVTGITRGYGVASLALELDSPAVSTLVSNVTATVSAVDTAAPTLVGPGGLVGQSLVGAVLAASNTVAVGLVMGTPTGTVTLSSINLAASLGGLLTTPLSDGKVTVDLTSGKVRVNLAALLGDDTAGLNDMPPNTSLALSGAQAASIATRVDTLVQAWSTQVTSAMLGAVRAATLTVNLTVPVRTVGLLAVAAVTIQSTGTVGDHLDGTATFQTTVATTGAAGLVNPVLAALLPGLTLNAFTDALRLALPTRVAGPVRDILVAQLSGRVSTLQTTLSTTRGALATALGAVTVRLPNALSLVVNVQPDRPGAPPGTAPVPGVPPYTSPTYSVTALRIGLAAPGASTGFAYVGMARSTVGPVTQVR